MKYAVLILCFGFYTTTSFAQQIAHDSTQMKVDSVSSKWSFAGSVYYYIFPDEENTGSFIGSADYKEWHLETRYNYEDENTGSVFGGYRFETGDKLVFGATPVLGAVFGNTNGISPGLELDVTWKKLDFYSESEYVFDLADKENNFLYTWTELAISPSENFRTGISANRTRLIHTDLDFERGVFAQYSFWKLTAGIHYFNPFSDHYFVLALLDFEI